MAKVKATADSQSELGLNSKKLKRKGRQATFHREETMKNTIGRMAIVVVLCFGLVNLSMAGEKAQGKGKAAKAVQSMSQEEQIKLALSAAPAHIAKDAAVMAFGADGKLQEVKAG